MIGRACSILHLSVGSETPASHECDQKRLTMTKFGERSPNDFPVVTRKHWRDFETEIEPSPVSVRVGPLANLVTRDTRVTFVESETTDDN
jgi:hypothetical protein